MRSTVSDAVIDSVESLCQRFVICVHRLDYTLMRILVARFGLVDARDERILQRAHYRESFVQHGATCRYVAFKTEQSFNRPQETSPVDAGD
jgi:hypothetical protein